MKIQLNAVIAVAIVASQAAAQSNGYYTQVNSSGTAAPAYVSVDSTPGTGGQSDCNSDCGIPGIGCCETGCEECSQLWQGACSEPGLGGGLLNNPKLISLAGYNQGCNSGGVLGGTPCASECAGNCTEVCGPACTSGCGVWAHYTSVFGEVLYLRARNAEIAYAVPIDGPIASPPAANPLQVGRVGVVDPDYETGYTGGVNLALNPLTSLNARYSSIDFQTANRIGTTPPNVIRSLVAHPSSQSTQTDFLSASASLGIDYDNFDLTLRHLFVGGDVFAVNYFVGARYSQLDQHFDSLFVDNETEQVTTDVDFEGVGLRLGLEAERHSCTLPLRIYARGATNFLAGRFRASYFQGTSFDPTIVDTHWEAGRVVPSLDLEVGVGWRSTNDRIRLNVGYRIDAWYNMVTNEDFIYAVQENNFLGLEDTMSFDGLVGQAEIRF